MCELSFPVVRILIIEKRSKQPVLLLPVLQPVRVQPLHRGRRHLPDVEPDDDDASRRAGALQARGAVGRRRPRGREAPLPQEPVEVAAAQRSGSWALHSKVNRSKRADLPIMSLKARP